MSRNDTSFPARSTARLRALHARYLAAGGDAADPEHAWARALKYYQYLVRAVYTDPEYGIGDGNARGLLIYATMGLGKTRLAAAVALSMADARPVVVLLARSLQRNFRETLDALAKMVAPRSQGENSQSENSQGENSQSEKEQGEKEQGEKEQGEKEQSVRYAKPPSVRYASMDAYNSADQLGGLDGKLLIVDEAHNFFRAIINSAAERSNARRMYDTIMAARNLRIVFLSGTPASKDPFELVPCFNMLAGADLLPTQYETFYELYVDRANHAVRNRERLANRLVGLVSHVSTARPTEPATPGAAAPGAAGPQPRDAGWFPEALPTIVERVPMAEHQYRQYMLARTKESAEGRGGRGAPDSGAARAGPPLALPGSEQKAARSYFVRSRALSIFASAAGASAAGASAAGAPAAGEIEAPKLELIARRAAAAPGPVLVYSQFIESGLKPLADILRRAGFAEATLGGAAGGGFDASRTHPASVSGGRQPRADRPPAEEFAPLGAADRKVLSAVVPKLGYTEAEAREIQRVGARERAFAPDDAWYDPAAAPPFEYRGGKAADIGRCKSVAKLTNLHHGQRKLFVSELQCLTHFCRDAAARLVVVYAGAAPGHHIPFFLRLFPGVEWHLYDPRAFDVPAGPNVHLYNEYFTDAVAESWRGRADVFISDIRLDAPTGASGWSPEFEAQVASDMKMQDDWTRLMRPRRGAMLKFRPPYLEAGAAASPLYTHGRVLWQTWPSVSSTEGRLIVAAADAVAPRRPFDAARYQSACAVHNMAVRPWATYAPPAAGLEAVPGYDRCFDCTNEAAAWVAYRALAHRSADGGVADLMNRLTAATRQRLDMAGARKKEHSLLMAMWHGLNAALPAPRRVMSVLRAACGYGGGADGAPRFAVISGEISQEARDAIVAAFNSPANAHGAVIKAILVSKTGAEGLDLKYIRETHQVEPYWDRARDDQVKARAVRLGSHDGLPRDERVVQPYLYVAVANRKIWDDMPARDREPHTIDEIFYDRAADRYTVNAAFRQLLAEVSLECGLFGYGGCRACVPTNAPLFHADCALDVRLPDPCEACRESEVQVTPVDLDGVAYYYAEDPAAALGYTFYTHSAALGGFAAIDPADPIIARLLSAVK